MNVVRHALRIGALIALTGSFAAAQWDQKVFDPKTGAELSPEAFAQRVGAASVVVLGERHGTPEVQKAQALLIETALQQYPNDTAPSIAWEFLNLSESTHDQALLQSYREDQITGEQVIDGIFNYPQYYSYVPILETVKHHALPLSATNLTHAEKKPVVQGGLAAADPTLVPAGFEMGSSTYRERFETALGGHSSPALDNYFAAQCLTDDVMAYQVGLLDRQSPRLLIVGAFHTEYSEGVVSRIRAREAGVNLLNVLFIYASDYAATDAELTQALPDILNDPHYGAIADLVYFVGEPAPQP